MLPMEESGLAEREFFHLPDPRHLMDPYGKICVAQMLFTATVLTHAWSSFFPNSVHPTLFKGIADNAETPTNLAVDYFNLSSRNFKPIFWTKRPFSIFNRRISSPSPENDLAELSQISVNLHEKTRERPQVKPLFKLSVALSATELPGGSMVRGVEADVMNVSLFSMDVHARNICRTGKVRNCPPRTPVSLTSSLQFNKHRGDCIHMRLDSESRFYTSERGPRAIHGSSTPFFATTGRSTSLGEVVIQQELRSRRHTRRTHKLDLEQR
ncbi:hypothetical protein BDN70DRAFT_899697 [Pholiota conissans]|uniref:Uncharacterized protein n=1 Tax=Pholiota conissans TaxID=109636 RepID=A0A9P6CU16_9AGAR|nr:hypothetical protein BDN70DRAFT_899697 [Pholiota conissans]